MMRVLMNVSADDVTKYVAVWRIVPVDYGKIYIIPEYHLIVKLSLCIFTTVISFFFEYDINFCYYNDIRKKKHILYYLNIIKIICSIKKILG